MRAYTWQAFAAAADILSEDATLSESRFIPPIPGHPVMKRPAQSGRNAPSDALPWHASILTGRDEGDASMETSPRQPSSAALLGDDSGAPIQP